MSYIIKISIYIKMEQSDGILISTLREYIAIPEDIVSLGDIKAQQLFRISIHILDYFKSDTSQIRNMAGKQQRFRSMAKLNQHLQTSLQTQLQLNELMNPNIPFLRRFMLTVINKLGTGDNTDKSKVTSNNQTSPTFNQEKNSLKQWLKDQWIHPALTTKRPKYRGYLLPLTINKNMLKNNINLSSELDNPLLNGNVRSILNQTESKFKQRVKQFEANQGFSRREQEESQIRLQNIIRTNRDDWLIGDNKLHRLKKKIFQQQQEEQNTVEEVTPSVFKQELEVAESEAVKKKEEFKPESQLNDEDTEADTNLNPFERLKRQAQNKKREYEIQIKAIIDQLRQKKDETQHWEEQKQRLEQQLLTDEQKIGKLKQKTVDFKKHVQKRQNILATLEGEKDIEEQVSKLESEVKQIEKQAKEQVSKMQREIIEVRQDSKEKMQALSELKHKLNKIETDYTRVCDEMVDKTELKQNVKIMKSVISRMYYHKKISDMEGRWRQTQKETMKLKKNLIDLREKTRMSSTLSLRVETQIQNILNVQKTRNQPQTKALRDLMNSCKQAFNNTMKTLEEVNNVKMQTQEYEVKVHTLSGKSYKQNIERIQLAMQDLNRQMTELSKSRNQ